MMKKATWWQTALLLVFAALLLFAQWQVYLVGDHLQYLIPAPAPAADNGGEEDNPPPPNRQLKEMQESLDSVTEEWQGVMARWTLTGMVDRASFSGSAGSATGRLTLMGKDGLTVQPLYLRSGRLFQPDEIRNGDRVILLDEQLALELFRVSEPIDREVQLNGATYRVIGIVRHAKRVGDLTEYGAYIPLNSVIDQSVALDALMVEAEPLKGVGASVAFSNVMAVWQPGGTVIDLGKEGMAAGLWLRVLVFLAAMTAVLRLIRWLNHQVGDYARRYRAQLQARYAVRLMPELIGVILLFILGYGAAAALIALAMNYIIQPVYTFTEWIPAVLVEWEDIAAAFWKVWQTPATLRELRSPELIRLRWLTLMTQGCSAGAGVLLALRYAKMRTAHEATAESLRALQRQGVAVSVLRTKRPIAMADAGYVALPGGTMARIIDAQQVLRSLHVPAVEGSFILEVTDALIRANNTRWQISCAGDVMTLKETRKEWDMQVSISALTEIVYGDQTLTDYVECSGGCVLRQHVPLMDALFDAGLTLTTAGETA
ncbi:MAG: ABC transporter permease, partial [Aristaeellaceae bacterium]